MTWGKTKTKQNMILISFTSSGEVYYHQAVILFKKYSFIGEFRKCLYWFIRAAMTKNHGLMDLYNLILFSQRPEGWDSKIRVLVGGLPPETSACTWHCVLSPAFSSVVLLATRSPGSTHITQPVPQCLFWTYKL